MGDFAFMTVQLPPSVDAVTPLGPKQDTGRMQIRLAEAQANPAIGEGCALLMKAVSGNVPPDAEVHEVIGKL